MKYLLHRLFFSASLLSLCWLTLRGQQPVEGMKQVLDIAIDNLGNATIEASMTLNAQQWDMMKRNMGNNTNMVKHNMEKALPKYFLTDFNYSEDQMERTYKIKFKVFGLCSINKEGVWEARLDTKNPDIIKLSDRDFVITQNYNTNGVLIQQTQKLHLPSGTGNAKLEKDSFGKAVLKYSAGGSVWRYLVTGLGILLIGGGGWMLYQGRGNKKQASR